MLILISPSKTQDFKEDYHFAKHTIPEFLDETAELNKILRKLSEKDIMELMDISGKLAKLNYERYHEFKVPLDQHKAKQAIIAFKGDVYTPIDYKSYNENDYDFAQSHLRILSGFYGLLRPLDLIMAYRLEMGIALENQYGKNLYQFWGNKITDKINAICKEKKYTSLVNLASNEYFAAINQELLAPRLINVQFKKEKNGKLQVIGLLAKKARGIMTNFIIKNKITEIKDLKEFKEDNYIFRKDLSNDADYIFTQY